jgi:hypothetical protein
VVEEEEEVWWWWFLLVDAEEALTNAGARKQGSIGNIPS